MNAQPAGRSPARPGLARVRESRLRAGCLLVLAATVLAATVSACDASASATPAITPGTSAQPREVIILTKDYTYLPAVLDLVPGETVVLQIVNGGLVVHEVVIGGMPVQDAWEVAEAATIGAPPGPTPQVSVAPELAGLRVVIHSGQRVDITWTVPQDAATTGETWLVGCHIPGHWAEGMMVPVRFVGPDGQPITAGTAAPIP